MFGYESDNPSFLAVEAMNNRGEKLSNWELF